MHFVVLFLLYQHPLPKVRQDQPQQDSKWHLYEPESPKMKPLLNDFEDTCNTEELMWPAYENEWLCGSREI